MDGDIIEVSSNQERDSRRDLPPLLQNVQLNGGAHVFAGRDVVNHVHHHHNEPQKNGSIPALEPIDNHRKIQQDTISKRTAKTGEWIFQYEQFPVWQDPNSSVEVLWGCGIAGAGKTVLTSVVIDFFETKAMQAQSSIIVGYFYIRYSDNANITVRNCLEVLVKQAVETSPLCFQHAQELYTRHTERGTRPMESELSQLLLKFRTVVDSAYYFLEGLDEAPAQLQYDLVKALSSLGAKLFITSRPLKALQELFPQVDRFEIRAQDYDLEIHIRHEIARNPNLSKILQGVDPKERDEIVATVKHACGGMFLHAALQMIDLRECMNIHDVRQRLSGFPSQIDEVYAHTWRRIAGQTQAQTCLLWVIGAGKSVTVEELRHAAATSLETRQFDETRLVPIDLLVSSCRGLLVVDEETQVVRLVHFTAHHPLCSLILKESPHLLPLFTSLCIAKLVDCGFQRWKGESWCEALDDALNATHLLSYAYHSWPIHARNSLHDPASFISIKQFIMSCRAFPAQDGDWIKLLRHPLHIVAHFDLPIALADSLALKVFGPNPKSRGETPLHRACARGSMRTLKELLSLPRINVDAVDSDGLTPIFRAVFAGQEAVFSLLFHDPRVTPNPVATGTSSKSGWTLLHAAAFGGNVDIVSILLAASQSTSALNASGETPLVCASAEGHAAVVELLLARSATEISIADKHGRTPLSCASAAGHLNVVKLLLGASRAEISVVDEDGQTPLHYAPLCGNAGVVKLLLEASQAETRVVNRWGQTPLSFAVTCMNAAAVKLLLATSQAEIGVVDQKGHTPLSYASQWGDQDVVELLLATSRTEIAVVDKEGRTPLSYASEGRKLRVVELLLAASQAETGVVDKEGRTPLSYASGFWHDEPQAVELLLGVSDAELNLPDKDGWTPLMWAARWGCRRIAEVLLNHPLIDVNRTDREGRTALKLAQKNSRSKEVAKLLLAHQRKVR